MGNQAPLYKNEAPYLLDLELELPQLEKLVERRDQRILQSFRELYQQWEASDQQSPAPVPPAKSTAHDVALEYKMAVKQYNLTIEAWKRNRSSYTQLYRWITETVHPMLLRAVQYNYKEAGKLSIQWIMEHLRRELAPSEVSITESIREDYNNKLSETRSSKVDPKAWLASFREIYREARTYRTQT
ncbi:hypothetical protein PZA11_000080 [Diplocarpon coronariae]